MSLAVPGQLALYPAKQYQALGISGGWLGLAEQLAEIEEVLLARGAFGEVGGLPLGNELLESHALPFGNG